MAVLWERACEMRERPTNVVRQLPASESRTSPDGVCVRVVRTYGLKSVCYVMQRVVLPLNSVLCRRSCSCSHGVTNRFTPVAPIPSLPFLHFHSFASSDPASPSFFFLRRTGPRMGFDRSMGAPLCRISRKPSRASRTASFLVSSIFSRHSSFPKRARGISLGQQDFSIPRFDTISFIVSRSSLCCCSMGIVPLPVLVLLPAVGPWRSRPAASSASVRRDAATGAARMQGFRRGMHIIRSCRARQH